MSSSPVPAEPARGPMGRFEIPLAALAAAGSFAALFVVPVVGALGVPFAAVPVVRLAHRRGLVAATLACALATAIILGLGWATGGPGDGLAMAFLAAGVTALPVASVGFLRAGVAPSRCYLGLGIAGCAFCRRLRRVSSGPALAAPRGRRLDGLIAAIESSTLGSRPRNVGGCALPSRRPEFARRYLWGLFGAFWVLGSAMAFYGGARAARPIPTAVVARFETLRVPALAAGLFVATGAAFGLLHGEGRRLAGNLLLPLLALFFVAGLSIICHFFRRWFRVRILRAGLYALAAYFPINVGVALLGLFDWYVDFRRRGEGVIEKS